MFQKFTNFPFLFLSFSFFSFSFLSFFLHSIPFFLSLSFFETGSYLDQASLEPGACCLCQLDIEPTPHAVLLYFSCCGKYSEKTQRKGGMDFDGFRFEVAAHYFWEVKAGTSHSSSPVKIKESKCSLGCLLPASFLLSYTVVDRTAQPRRGWVLYFN